jgi:cytosine/uracil/thiamine/allantoin permease
VKIVPVIASVVIIVLVALVQGRSRELAALLAVMPLTVPLAAWIVFSASGNDYEQTADFVRAMVVGYLATVVFVIACWYGLRQHWPFALVIAFAFGVWGALVSLPHVVRRIF